ncbi:hypothetical protein [uncultured Muribaculum sp.]|uniref:hypothetical protein n=1 Tax=uncultured Muribaculum sp. TaxID=1918613 RepID=UPI00267482B5|nr:hypothetical protein [uncultured Muribaculum sp.]
MGLQGVACLGLIFLKKKLQKHLEVTAKVCNFALAFEKEAGQRPGTDSGLTTFPTIFLTEKFGGKEKIRNFARLFRGTDPEGGKRTLTNIAIDKEVVQDKSGCGHAPQPESPVIS